MKRRRFSEVDKRRMVHGTARLDQLEFRVQTIASNSANMAHLQTQLNAEDVRLVAVLVEASSTAKELQDITLNHEVLCLDQV